MSDLYEKQLAELKTAFESGALTEETYNMLVASLKASAPTPPAPQPTGKRSIQVDGDVGRNIVTGNENQVEQFEGDTIVVIKEGG